MSEIKYEIIKKVGVLSTSASGWAKEVNLISWSMSCMGCPLMKLESLKGSNNHA